MHIFVDESGIFVVPLDFRPHVCCVATLAASDASLARLRALHSQLLTDWSPAAGELKGRDLNERNFRRIFTGLAQIDVVPTIVAIDMALQSDSHTASHKLRQAAKMRDSVAGPEFFDSFRRDVHALAARLEQLPNQLYIQSIIQTEVVARTIRAATLHYAQTDPATLGIFRWHVDSKDKTIQECESLWSDLVRPFLQTLFLEKPLLHASGDGFDYSAMDYMWKAAAPEHLVGAAGKRLRASSEWGDLNPLAADITFCDSRSTDGVQFADVIASAFCRACNGRLGHRGWQRLGRLLIRHPEDRQAVYYISLGPVQPIATLPYGALARSLEADARGFLFADS